MREKEIPIFQVDAFTNERFHGNPAAICVLENEDDLTNEQMQNIAAEMNLSETAFIIPMAGKEDHSKNYHLRWFTPAVEVSLCGHATLATAHVLFKELKVCREEVHFQTLSGELIVLNLEDKYSMDFPLGNPQPADMPNILFTHLGIPKETIISTHKNEFKDEIVGIIEVNSERLVRELNPNWTAMSNTDYGMDLNGVYVTAKSDMDDVDFVSRCFFPWIGINEDPVTGSAHTVLGPYWKQKLGKPKLVAHQVSKRLGKLWLKIPDDNPNKRIFIKGNAITVAEGSFKI
jgi:PhzF family phenazine biosynthesis protein